MKNELITQLKSQFDILAQNIPTEEIEFWFARSLQIPLGYSKWDNFLTAIKRAIVSCETTGYNPENHFRPVVKKITHGKGGFSNKKCTPVGQPFLSTNTQ